MTDDFRSRLIELIDWAAARERELLQPFRNPNRPTAGEAWSADDVVWHLASWRRVATELLADVCAGREPADASDVDARNAKYLAEGRGLTRADVDRGSEEILRGLKSELQRAPEECMQRELTGARAGQAAWESVTGNAFGHAVWHVASFLVDAEQPKQAFDLYAEAEARLQVLPNKRFWLEDRYNLACLRIRAGQPNEAISLLRDVLPQNASLREFAPQDPDLAALRGMAEFEELVRT